MSDDRYKREPGDDTDEVPGKPYVDPKPRSWYTPAPPFDLAAECDKFLDRFCAELGIKRDAKKKRGREQEADAAQAKPVPTAEDWKKL